MGISFSSGRRNHNQHAQSYYNPPPPPPPPPPAYYYPTSSPDPSSLNPPPPPQPQLYTQYPNTAYQHNYLYPPPAQSNYYHPSLNPNAGWYNYGNPMMSRHNNAAYNYFPANYGNGWGGHHVRDPQPPPPPPPYVEHQSAKVVKNDVNVHKDTIKLLVDESFPDRFLLSFVFDAHYHGSITLYYFAKEDTENFKFTTMSTSGINPVKVPFEKGIAQRFQQPSGTGVDLNFFDSEYLGEPSEDDVFPLVIFAEVHSSSENGDHSAECTQRVQITQAVIEKKNGTSFQVKVKRQILWIDRVRYELRDLYGIGNTSSEGFSDDDPGKECVICMTEPKNTAVIPCRHLCLCSDCAKELRLQTNKCPICRQEISELIEIKINNNSDE